MDQIDSENISQVVIHLMKGILYKEEKPKIWESLERLEGPVKDYLSVINLNLMIFESDGFAYLTSKEQEEGDSSLPQIMARRPLSYPVSLILALLRRKLTEHDTYSSEPRLIIEVNELANIISSFFPSSNNEVKVLKKLNSHLQRIQELGFIRFLDVKKEKFEVKRILKAYIDAQWLHDFDQKLGEYISNNSGDDDV